jgi:hypothetical protein
MNLIRVNTCFFLLPLYYCDGGGRMGVKKMNDFNPIPPHPNPFPREREFKSAFN